MAFNLSFKDVEKIFINQLALHTKMSYRFKHYKGKLQFLKSANNSDGSKKSDVSINFLDYIVDAHTSGSTSNPINYVTEEEEKAPVENLSTIYESNNLEMVDSEHFRNSLIYGYSVELLGVQKGAINAAAFSPLEWAFVYDAQNEVQIAIHKAEIQANTIYQSEYIRKPFIVFTVFDNSTITIYRKSEKGEGEILDRINHFFGKVPVILFRVNPEREAFLNDNLIELNNQYCRLVNARVDDIEYNVDSLLKITGMGGFDVTDPTQIAKLKAMKDAKVFITPDVHSDVNFIQKGNEGSKYIDAIQNAREELFLQARLPDRRDVQGALGSLSGIAIKFMYQTSISQSEYFLKYFKQALRERIQLINNIWYLQGNPLLSNFSINTNYCLPVDLESIASSVKNLENIVSHTKLLEMLPDVNPEQEKERINQESNPAPAEAEKIAQKPVEQLEKETKQKDATITKSASNAREILQEKYMNNLQGTVADEIIKSDEFKNLFPKGDE